jgi:hypothetical protein
MRRVVIGAALLTTVCATAGIASSRDVTPRQSVIVNISDPVVLRGHVLMGPYLVVHDDDRMARGEPCTSIYKFDRDRGPQALEVEFMCQPTQRKICETTKFSVRHSDAGLNVVTEYQFAGDPEAHIVPAR